MAWTIATDDAATAARFLSSAADGGRGPLAAALLRNAEAVLKLPGIPTLECYPFTLAVCAIAALVHGEYDRSEHLCAQAVAANVVRDDEVDGYTAVVRAHIARFGGDPSRTIEHHEQALRHFRRVVNPYQLARVLNVLAVIRMGSGDLACATDEARESVSIARQTGNPGLTSCALAGLAYVLAYSEPERSRALVAESLELNLSLGVTVVDEVALVETIVASAMLGDRDDVLKLSALALDRGLTATYRLISCLEPVAEALAVGLPAVTALIHGHIDAIAPRHALGEPHRSFRDRAAARIETQLDPERIVELRARGAVMTPDEASVFTLAAIAGVLEERGI